MENINIVQEEIQQNKKEVKMKAPVLFTDNDMTFEVYAESFADFAKLVTKMTKAMSKIERIEKNGFNSYYKYEYATADDVEDAARKVLAEVGIAMFASVANIRKNVVQTNNGTTTIAEVKMNYMFVDKDTGASIVTTYYGAGLDSQDKYLYKAYTGAQKYAIKNNLHISTGDADDPEHDSTDVFLNKVNNHYPANNNVNKNNNYNKSKYVKNTPQNNTLELFANNNVTPIEKIRGYYRTHQEDVETIIYTYLKENNKNEDISLLNELKDKELNEILNEIEKEIKNKEADNNAV